jgi:hypothetical protein
MFSMPSPCELCRGEVSHGLVGPVVVALLTPVLDEHLGLEETVEGFEV